MRRSRKDKTTGSKGFDPKEGQGLARCAWRGQTGAGSPSGSDCFNYKLGTWNVRSLRKKGKIANVMQEMRRMEVNIMGVAETCWQESGSITSQIPKERKDGMGTDTDEDAGGDTYRIFYSEGDKNRRGVGLIMAEEVLMSVMIVEPISKRIMVMRLKMKPTNVLIVQIYAPCEDEEEEEKDQFYESLDQALREYKKGRECLVVMGDFNGKAGNGREENIVGPYGLGTRNENGDRLVNFCRKQNVFVTNTWFQQKRTAQYTWTSPGGRIKNQIDFVLVDIRFRNGVQNSKAMSGARCETD